MANSATDLKIVVYPHPVLAQRAEDVSLPDGEVTDEVAGVAMKMLELMHEAPGVGLAAPQVGLAWRLFVANPSGEPDDDHVFINPVLEQVGTEFCEFEEGCLSLPEITAVVRRPKQITIRATGLDGKPIEMTSDDFPARVWQHECDHLEGKLLLNRMSPLDRFANRKLIKALEAAG